MTARKLTALVTALLLAFTVCFSSELVAYAEAPGYTGVLDDLKRDPTFNESDYPENPKDYSVQVISVAESEDKELFVYTYIPSAGVKGYKASTINISTAINESLQYRNYALTELGSTGTLGKYKVEGITVKDDALRYYDISSVYRKYDSETDEAAQGGGTVTETAFEVAKLFTACTVDGKVSYACTATEVITVTDRTDGFIRYSNGFALSGYSSCDSWYIAFNTDRNIAKLMEADVYFASWTYWQTVSGPFVDHDREYETDAPQANYVYLEYTDRVTHTGNGLFARTYSWDRIESAVEFAAKEDLTGEALEALAGKKWVLRYTETEYYLVSSQGYTSVHATEISDVTILRLKFETDGVVYNLGVVDNKQTPDNATPDNNNTNELDIFGSRGCGNVGWQFVLIVLVIVLLVMLLAPFLPTIVSLLLKVIALPFVLLARGVKKAAEKVKECRRRKKAEKDEKDKTPKA